VLAGVSLALIMVGYFFPHASAATALAAVPTGVLAYRHRQRAVVAAAVAGATVAFLVAGTGPLVTVAGCALIGGSAGHARRRGWGWAPTVLAAAAFAPPLGAAADALLAVFAQSRRLSLAQVVNTWKGAARALRQIPLLGPVVHAGTVAVDGAVRWWWVSVPAGILVTLAGATLVAWVVTGPVAARLEWVPPGDLLDAGGRAGAAPVGPVPATLRGVGYRYADAGDDALAAIDLDVAPGTFTVIVGPNGSGKSTLGRILLGAEPTAGTVIRNGAVGLGQPGGAAAIMQRPETQILGVRVVDDLRWGLPTGHAIDVAGLLAAVGLDGMEQRDTTTLSGGELQRLAVAGALARRPRLLVSDESTAMVDAAGRRALVELLRRLPAEQGTAVVHITHRMEETAGADQVVALAGGRRVPVGRPVVPGDHQQAATGSGVGTGAGLAATGRRSPAAADDYPDGGGDLVVEGVSHVWAAGTPWRQPALDNVDLHIGPGEGVLVLGGNGSGKSTLAWVLAGLLVPSRGRCLLGGIPVPSQVGSVGLAFQHARLQLLRPTVLSDVRHAGAVPAEVAREALRAVGVSARELGGRRVDQLSGGQMRRVALAGLLARRPRVVVLDEPLAGLDDAARDDLLGALSALRYDHGVTVVMVSHDLAGTQRVCDRVVSLQGGRVVEDRPMAEPAWR
jgi:energy-coupling factor transporter ATP-binding protein EcfA2